MENSLESFLATNNISQEVWEGCQLDWSTLQDIAADHIVRSEDLRATASYFASAFQATDGVHSVRWRIKDPDHLVAKIIRKKSERSEKYENIGVDNYHTIITDLIGVRVLHLFKHEYEGIDLAIRAKWNLHETPPIHYIRTGDTTPQNFKKELFDEKPHPAGYRSIHYVLKTQPTIRECLVEVQVRTIFEEGWSEIDHKIRYPNFSDNALVNYFLTIFNRMAGSADEMGTFVKELSVAFALNDLKTSKLTNERDETLKKMDALVGELAVAKGTGNEYQETIKKLQSDIQSLKANSSKEALASYSSWMDEIIRAKSISASDNLNKYLYELKVPKTWNLSSFSESENSLAKLADLLKQQPISRDIEVKNVTSLAELLGQNKTSIKGLKKPKDPKDPKDPKSSK